MSAGYNTPTDASLISAINYAHSLGLAVDLKPHLESYDTSWRANINPSDRTAWFNSYSTMLNHYGSIAQASSVEMITIGTELIDMSSDNLNSANTSNWQNIIASLRNVYSGKLTYSANWGGGDWNDEVDHIKFWSSLDYIGVSAYYHVANSTNYNMSDLQNNWNQIYSSQLQPLASRDGKQIIFTEVGYRSVNGALTHPASWTMTGPADEQEQADGYNALFNFWQDKPNFAGVQLWEWKSWPAAGGASDTDFTPQNKLAQTTITNWFTNNHDTPPPPPTPLPTSANVQNLSDLAWQSATNGWGPVEKDMSNGEQAAGDGHTITINGQTYAKGLGVNAKSKIIYSISNCTNFRSDIGVDDEVTTKGSVNFQVWSGPTKIYDSGLMTFADPAKTVNLDITGVTSLALIVTDGGNGNGHDHADWANPTITCNIPTNTPPPPPPTSTPSGIIDVWWPTDGATISGMQPLKGLVENLDISQYQMYWQVNSQPAVLMSDSSVDWPHKESAVDVSTWDSNSTLTFIAKDLSGNIIAQKTVTVQVVK